MKPKIVEDWRRVMALSLSFWAQVAGLLVLIVPEVRYALTGRDYNPYVAWWLGVLLLLAGLIGRLFRQTDSALREWLRIAAVVAVVFALALLLASKVGAQPATEAQVMQVAVPFIAKEEGLRLHAYRDSVGVPTICNGHTKGVRMGDTATEAQCRTWLREEASSFWASLSRFFSPQAVARWLPATRGAAYLSTAYNVGPERIGRSTAVARLNVGNVTGGCEALTWWNRAGGRVLRGLVARRTRERALCMIGA